MIMLKCNVYYMQYNTYAAAYIIWKRGTDLEGDTFVGAYTDHYESLAVVKALNALEGDR